MILNFNKKEIEKLKFLAESSLINSNWLLDKLKEGNKINKVYLVAHNPRMYPEGEGICFDEDEEGDISKIFIDKEKAKEYMIFENKLTQEKDKFSDEDMKRLSKNDGLDWIMKEIPISDASEFKRVTRFNYTFQVDCIDNKTSVTITDIYNPPDYLINEKNIDKNLNIHLHPSKRNKRIVIVFTIEKTNDLNMKDIEKQLADLAQEIYCANINGTINKYNPQLNLSWYKIILPQEQYLKRTL